MQDALLAEKTVLHSYFFFDFSTKMGSWDKVAALKAGMQKTDGV